MTWILVRPALFVLIAFAALLAPQFAGPVHAASTITVNSFDDDVNPNSSLSLREAIMLATGDLTLAELTEPECDQVNPAMWGLTNTCTVIFPSQPPGPTSSDTIVFDAGKFPTPPATQFILLNVVLPSLDTGNDTIDGSSVGVGLSGIDQTHECLRVRSDHNTVKGLQIMQCDVGIIVFETFLSSANDNVIGGTTEDERNVFSQNGVAVILNGNAHNNRLIGNYIGTNSSGTAGVPNNVGVVVSSGAHDNIIGGTTAPERNVISGNTEVGLTIGNVDRTVIHGNYIGTNAAGDAAVPNLVGVRLSAFAQANRIGGAGAGEGNVISGNITGVAISGANAQLNIVAGNLIGTDATGTTAMPNVVGVNLFDEAHDNTIGGDTPGARNVISANTNSGVRMGGSGTIGNTVAGNYIGADASGEQALGNGGYGIQLSVLSSDNLIRDNVIVGNGLVGGPSVGGITLFSSESNEIYDNRIGVSPSDAPLGNEGFGIYMLDSSNNTIGTTDSDGNIIAFNAENGVHVTTDSGQSIANTIRGNSIYSNGGKGIANVDGGNEELPPPVITGFGSVNGTACADCTIDVYSDDEDEGAVYEGTTTADGNGDWTLPGIPGGPNVTTTATDAAGNTSEFSDEVVAPEPTPTPVPTPTPIPTATPGGQTPTPTGTPPVGESVAWGDNNCSQQVDPVDSLFVLRGDAGLPTNTGECPDMGAEIEVLNASPHIWGDVDCKDGMTPVDSLKILRFDAGLSVAQEAGCPTIGSEVTVVE